MTVPFSITRRVQFRDTDAAGIAHFTSYFGYMEEAEHEMLRDIGMRVMTEDAEGTISWPRVSAHCDFRSPIRFDDEFQVEVCVAELNEKSVKYGFRFICDEKLIAEGYAIAACCRILPGAVPKSIPIPDGMRERLAPMKVS
jgi:4-hydroxybenzoyl-CoA thioesterase/acyl-CoA thioester hydrolase